MQITPYSFEYWVISSLIAFFLYIIGVYFDLSAPKKSENKGFYYSLSILSYFTALFIVAAIALQYIGYKTFEYMLTKAQSDISRNVWANSFFPWNVPPLITMLDGVAFIAIVLVGITAFRLGILYIKVKEV